MAGRDRMAIEEVVRQVLPDEHGDVIRESVRAVARELMEAEVPGELIGAEHRERTEDRATHRNGSGAAVGRARGRDCAADPQAASGSYVRRFCSPAGALGAAIGVEAGQGPMDWRCRLARRAVSTSVPRADPLAGHALSDGALVTRPF